MKSKSFYLTIFITLVLAVLPFLIISTNSSFPKLPFELTDDSLYYQTRSADIFLGHPYVGNPYTKEHALDNSPVFFVGDWLWSTPLLFGFSPFQSIILKQVFWFLLFSSFLYALFGLFLSKVKLFPLYVNFVLLSVFWYLQRPVAMQVVFPLFIGFLALFYHYLSNYESRKSCLALGVYSGLVLYTYTYLAQIMALVFIFLFIFSFFGKFKEYRKGIFVSGLISFVLSIPFLIYTYIQTKTPFYLETVKRLGLINTHSLSSTSIIYSVVCISFIFFILSIREKLKQSEFIFYLVLTLALLLSILSNLFTGVDFELATHISRFIDLWAAIIFIIFLEKIIYEKFQ